MLPVIILYALCASTFTLSKAALAYTTFLFYSGVRVIGAGILVLGMYWLTCRHWPRVTVRDAVLFAHIPVIGIYIATVTDLWPLQFISSVESSLVFSVTPFITAFFSYLWFGEVMTWRKWVALGIGISSSAPLLYRYVALFGTQGSGNWCALIVHMISVIASAYAWIVMRELVKEQGYSPLFINGVAMLCAGPALLASSALFEQWSPLPVTAWGPFLLLVGGIIVLANVLFTNLYSYLLRRYTATFLSFAGFTCPLFASLFGYVFLGEALYFSFFVSFVAVFVGLYLFYREEVRQGYVE